MGYKGRDVEITFIDENNIMVIACDSCGAVGEKEFDVVNAPAYVVGRLTARVSLMEIISTGAVPKMLSTAISCELSPTGEKILEGIRDELINFDIENMPMAISTEKNFETKQTSLGITVVGLVNKSSFRIASSIPGDVVYCLGIPKVGNEISGAYDADIAQAAQLIKLINTHGIHDVIPIGSMGIIGEVISMAKNANVKFKLANDLIIDVKKSAGPSTCLIFTCSPNCIIPDFINTPINLVGKLY
jgi:selenophosphate synthetase-related protein